MPNEQPIQRWRCPAVLRVQTAVFAAVGVTIALVFFPLWFAIPVATVLAAVYVGMAVIGMSVAIDGGAGLLVFRLGLLTRRFRLTDITAVLVDQAKVSVAVSSGVEVSLYIWGKSWLLRWLRAPAEATDIGHAIAGAVALARDDHAVAGDVGTDRPPVRTGGTSSASARSALSAALLGGVGVLAIIAALLVRVHWHNAAMTALAVILALVLGISGLVYLLFAVLILLLRRSARLSAD